MTRLMTRAGSHAAVHSLARRVGCTCPDCEPPTGRQRFEAFEADDLLDEAAGASTRLRGALEGLLSAMRWTGWQPIRGQPPSLRLLNEFYDAGGVERFTSRQGRPRLRLSEAGRRMIAAGARYRSLHPFVDGPWGGLQRLYRISGPPPHTTVYYIGKTTLPVGVRVLEHLRLGTGVTRRLRAEQRNWGGMFLHKGRIRIADQGRRSHLAEVALMELARSRWNPPSAHGFDEGDENDW